MPKLMQLSVLILLVAITSGLCEGQGGRGIVQEHKSASSFDFGAYHAVIIGIDRYKEWPQLRFAEKDAADMGQILINRYHFAAEHVVYLIGPKATRGNILREVRRQLETLGEHDNLLIYYAGHGQLDPLTETGYWIPVDGSLEDESSWASFSDLTTLLTGVGVRAKNIIVLTDSCYGGALVRSGPTPGHHGPEDLGYEQYLDQLRTLGTKRSRQVIASGGYEQVPDRSYFAGLLKEALEKNPYPVVDLEFLFYQKIYPELKFIGHQEPIMDRLVRGPKEDGQFILSKKVSRQSPSEGPSILVARDRETAPMAETATGSPVSTPSDTAKLLGKPQPLLLLKGTETMVIRGEEFVAYNLAIKNWSDFTADLFLPAPDLAPCGLNRNASRTWVTIYDAKNDRAIYSYCAMNSPKELSSFSFRVRMGDKPPERIYVSIDDRRKGTRYRSDPVKISGP